MSKTYTNKSNAARAAKKANGGTLEGLRLEGTAGAWHYAADVPATPVEPAKPAKKEKAPRTSQAPADRIRVSQIERPTKRVWHIADAMPEASRKEVLEACRKEGIAFYTARTQYQLWKNCGK